MKLKQSQKGFSLLEIILALGIIIAVVSMAYTYDKEKTSAQQHIDQRWSEIIQSSPSSSRVVFDHLRNECENEIQGNDKEWMITKYQKCVDNEMLRLAAQVQVSQMDSIDFDRLREDLANSF